jgi:hypothetical protein
LEKKKKKKKYTIKRTYIRHNLATSTISMNFENFKISGDHANRFLGWVIAMWKHEGMEPLEFDMATAREALELVNLDPIGRLLKDTYNNCPPLRDAFTQVSKKRGFYIFNPKITARKIL